MQAAKVNREKGLSAAGSKAALAGNENEERVTCSLYKQEFGNLEPKSAEMKAHLQVLQSAVCNQRL